MTEPTIPRSFMEFIEGLPASQREHTYLEVIGLLLRQNQELMRRVETLEFLMYTMPSSCREYFSVVAPHLPSV